MRLEFGDGFSAILGPNNSGKSSALRSVYELRNLFLNPLACLQETTGFRLNTGLLGVSDISELANDDDPHRFRVAVELPAPTQFDNPEYFVATQVHYEFVIHDNVFRPIKVVAARSNGDITSLDEHAIRSVVAPQVAPTFAYKSGQTVDYSGINAFCVKLGQSRYFPAFRNAINEGAATYYDIPVGTALVAAWDSWKAGNNRTQKMVISRVEREIASLLGFRSLQINADQSNKTLDVIINDKPHKLYEIGAGVAQLIITFGAAVVQQLDAMLRSLRR
jgi:hypothetical protein